jgi:hypothetical protein
MVDFKKLRAGKAKPSPSIRARYFIPCRSRSASTIFTPARTRASFGRNAALAQHLADRNATGGSQGPGGKTTP